MNPAAVKPVRTIWKETLQMQDHQSLTLPPGAAVLSVEEQRGEIVLYVLVDPRETATEEWAISIYGTGHLITSDQDGAKNFVGTVKIAGGGLMFHVFASRVG